MILLMFLNQRQKVKSQMKVFSIVNSINWHDSIRKKINKSQNFIDTFQESDQWGTAIAVKRENHGAASIIYVFFPSSGYVFLLRSGSPHEVSDQNIAL